MAFPTLTSKPVYPLSPDGEKASNVIRSESEAGYVQVRARATAMPRRWGLRYELKSSADYAALVAWGATAEYSTHSWTHPISAVVYTVRMVGPMQVAQSKYSFWTVSFTLEEAL